MLDVYDELRELVALLDDQNIDYALCGGMAMGVYGRARTTIDIDMLVPSESLEKVITVAKSLRYNIRGKDLTFANGAIEIRRVSKFDPESGDPLSLDFLLVTPEIRAIWDARAEADWEGGKLSVVSRAGLIELKRLATAAWTRTTSGLWKKENEMPRVDMSAHAVTTRLKRISQLRRLCLSLQKATVTPRPTRPEASDLQRNSASPDQLKAK